MSLDVRVLCRPAVATGFRLAGVLPIEVVDLADGARQLEVLLDEPGHGVVLVEDEIYAAVPEATRRELDRRPLPMVVSFPGPTWTVPREGPEAFIAELLRQAIGYRVRFG